MREIEQKSSIGFSHINGTLKLCSPVSSDFLCYGESESKIGRELIGIYICRWSLRECGKTKQTKSDFVEEKNSASHL